MTNRFNLYLYKGKYTDNRGLPIPDERILESLTYLGKDEAEIVNFLGKELMETPGAAYYFLEMCEAQLQFYSQRNSKVTTQKDQEELERKLDREIQKAGFKKVSK